MGSNHWISQADAMRLLSVSRQQIHRLRKAGALRFRYVPGPRGPIPVYWKLDVEARRASDPKPGKPKKTPRSPKWEAMPILELANFYIRRGEKTPSSFILDLCIHTCTQIDEPAQVMVEKIKTGRDVLGHMGRFFASDASRLRVLALIAMGEPCDWRSFAEAYQASYTESERWNDFARNVLPKEFRGKGN